MIDFVGRQALSAAPTGSKQCTICERERMADSDVTIDELPLESAGQRLRRAREAAGLSLGDVAARTKIAERHLASVEESRFGALASRTYAVGFARAYARSVALDEAEIAQAVREELAESDASKAAVPKVDAFEPGDPARVPGSRLAWAAGLGAVLVIICVFVFWRGFFSPAVSLPELTAETQAEASGSAAPVVATAPAGGPVVFTATAPGIWVKFYDSAGKTLLEKQLAQGESFTVPADANGPLIRTARPDALAITVGGRPVPALRDKATNVRDVPVTAAALLARSAPAVVPGAPASAAPAAATAPVQPALPARPAATAPLLPRAVQPSPAPRPAPTSTPVPASTPTPAAPAAAQAPPPAAVAPAEPSTVSN
jgi:cytoskeleton protein RodZ